jgi:hypothetical protein
MLVDFDIVSGGETASPMQRLLQQIDIIMTAMQYQIIHDAKLFINFDGYLFKTGLNTGSIADRIKSKISDGIDNQAGYLINVEVGYVSTNKPNDLLLVNIVITSPSNESELMQYTVLPSET